VRFEGRGRRGEKIKKNFGIPNLMDQHFRFIFRWHLKTPARRLLSPVVDTIALVSSQIA
jgi:hypothetical protein